VLPPQLLQIVLNQEVPRHVSLCHDDLFFYRFFTRYTSGFIWFLMVLPEERDFVVLIVVYLMKKISLIILCLS